MWAFILFFVSIGLFFITLIVYLILKAIHNKKGNHKKKVK